MWTPVPPQEWRRCGPKKGNLMVFWPLAWPGCAECWCRWLSWSSIACAPLYVSLESLFNCQHISLLWAECWCGWLSWRKLPRNDWRELWMDFPIGFVQLLSRGRLLWSWLLSLGHETNKYWQIAGTPKLDLIELNNQVSNQVCEGSDLKTWI